MKPIGLSAKSLSVLAIPAGSKELEGQSIEALLEVPSRTSRLCCLATLFAIGGLLAGPALAQAGAPAPSGSTTAALVKPGSSPTDLSGADSKTVDLLLAATVATRGKGRFGRRTGQERERVPDQDVLTARLALAVRTINGLKLSPQTAASATAAAKSLATGDARDAAALLQQQADAKLAQIEAGKAQVADLLLQQATLLETYDSVAALAALEKVLALDPDNPEASLRAGDLAVQVGDTDRAMRHYRNFARIVAAKVASDPGNGKWQRDLSSSRDRLGDLLALQGDTQAALTSYREGLSIAKALAARDSANAEWQGNLAQSHDNLADKLVVLGDTAAALASYRDSLTIRKTLSVRDPASTSWQNNLARSYENIGNILEARGDSGAALASYRDSFAIARALATRDPANVRWQNDLWANHLSIGDALAAQGDLPAALTSYSDGLAIAEALATRDPGNGQWQRNLAVTHIRIGDTLEGQRDSSGAWFSFQEAHDIFQTIAARDPANSQWQRALAVSHTKIGDSHERQGEYEAALASHRSSLAILKGLVTRDPANSDWQRDLAIGFDKIGDMLDLDLKCDSDTSCEGDKPGDSNAALANYRESLAIRKALAERDPTNSRWQRDLSFSYSMVGDMLGKLGDTDGALASYRESLAIIKTLATRDPANRELQVDLALALAEIASKSSAIPLAERKATLEDSRRAIEAIAAKDPTNKRFEFALISVIYKLHGLEADPAKPD